MEWMLLPLKRYAEFSGRSRRQEFWMFMLGTFLLYFVLMIVAMTIGFGALGMAATGGANAMAGGMVGLFASMGLMTVVIGVLWLGLLIPTLAVSVRRLHDSDRSGWWLLLYFAPYLFSTVFKVMAVSANSGTLVMLAGLLSLVGLIGAIVLLVFYCLPGTPGPNRFGPDPLGGTAYLAETFR